MTEIVADLSRREQLCVEVGTSFVRGSAKPSNKTSWSMPLNSFDISVLGSVIFREDSILTISVTHEGFSIFRKHFLGPM